VPLVLSARNPVKTDPFQKIPTKQKGVKSSTTQCLFQTTINRKGCSRNGIWHKNGRDDEEDGDIGHPNALASSWIVSVDASISLTQSEQNQEYGRIPTVVRRGPSVIPGPGLPVLQSLCCWLLPGAEGSSTVWHPGVFLPPTVWHWLTWIVLDKPPLNGHCSSEHPTVQVEACKFLITGVHNITSVS